jgi:hypothetical protein
LKRRNLDEWCADPTHDCEISAAEQLRLVCAKSWCHDEGCLITQSDNACGGDTVAYWAGVDAYGELREYDKAGKLVAVHVADGNFEDCSPPPKLDAMCSIASSTRVFCAAWMPMAAA